MMGEYKAYPPVQQLARKFGTWKEGSARMPGDDVVLPAGQMQYNWKEFKLQEALTPEQASRVRYLNETESSQVPLKMRSGFTAVDAKGKPIRDNFNEGKIVLGKTPQQAFLAGQLAQEGNGLAHCVGGYCKDVLGGNSRILSLRDQNGRSYATAEIKGTYIAQISGPGNKAVPRYVEVYTQDLVRSGKWGEVDGQALENAGLVHKWGTNDYITRRESNIEKLPQLKAEIARTEEIIQNNSTLAY